MRNETVGTIKSMKYDLYCLLYVSCCTVVTFSSVQEETSFRSLCTGLCVNSIHVQIQSTSVIFSFTCVTLDGKL
jgi:hypothetical protein